MLEPNDFFKMSYNFNFDDPIKTSTLFILTSAQKNNIDVILDEQIVFTKNGEIKWFLVCWAGQLNLDCT